MSTSQWYTAVSIYFSLEDCRTAGAALPRATVARTALPHRSQSVFLSSQSGKPERMQDYMESFLKSRLDLAQCCSHPYFIGFIGQ